MKRIATIQDFSCVGKCSLTAALPIISAAGVECCGIPTAVLSNHTGFSSFYMRDLTDDLDKISDRLKAHRITFDAVYTGYIASVSQMDFIKRFIGEFRGENTLIFVDPVMGDNGKLYSQITADYAEGMRGLCAEADVITPNLTEACLLLNADYNDSPGASEIREMLRGLVRLGAKAAVITGITNGSEIGCEAFDGVDFYRSFSEKQRFVCTGTGDIFSSVLVSALLRGMSFERALAAAVKFTGKAAELTASDFERRGYGVNFEEALPTLPGLLGIV